MIMSKMITVLKSITPEKISLSYTKNKEEFERHKKTASALLAAAVNHLKASTYFKQGDYEKAEHYAHLADEDLIHIIETQRGDFKTI